MKRSIYIIFIILIFQACYHDRSPEVIIPPEEPPISIEEMSEILVDMHLAQSAIKEMQSQKKDIQGISEEYHARILKKHGVTKEELDKSLEYYNYRTEELKVIYEEVITKLSLMESELKTRTQDSIP
jgi:hypothetical protein